MTNADVGDGPDAVQSTTTTTLTVSAQRLCTWVSSWRLPLRRQARCPEQQRPDDGTSDAEVAHQESADGTLMFQALAAQITSAANMMRDKCNAGAVPNGGSDATQKTTLHSDADRSPTEPMRESAAFQNSTQQIVHRRQPIRPPNPQGDSRLLNMASNGLEQARPQHGVLRRVLPRPAGSLHHRRWLAATPPQAEVATPQLTTALSRPAATPANRLTPLVRSIDHNKATRQHRRSNP
jgi:hypothetical protein